MYEICTLLSSFGQKMCGPKVLNILPFRFFGSFFFRDFLMIPYELGTQFAGIQFAVGQFAKRAFAKLRIFSSNNGSFGGGYIGVGSLEDDGFSVA